MNKLFTLMLFAFSILLSSCSQGYGLSYTKQTVGQLGYDHFVTANQAIDIVFLIDRSGSMGDDLDRMNQTLPSIYSILTGPDFVNLDWRVGMKSMGPASTMATWVESGDPDAVLKLLTLSSYMDYSGNETGLDAALNSLIRDTSFHRDDADLLFVFLSDEEDQSLVDPTVFQSVIDTIKQPPFIITEAAIVFTGNDTSCVNSGASVGTGYIDVADVVIDLCNTASWTSILDQPKEHLPTLNLLFELSELPVLPINENLRVFINGEETWDYEWDMDLNAIRLDYPPLESSSVEVVYLVDAE